MKLSYWMLFLTLYFLQGFPSGLLVHAMPPLLRSSGMPVEYIGLLKLLAIPWVFKFLWAPYVDRYYVKQLGAHRSWIILMQVSVVLAVCILAFTDISQTSLTTIDLLIIFALIFCINLFCATQDIATDGLAVKILPSHLRGLGNSVQVSGYKIGLLLGGSAILWGTDIIGWQSTMLVMAMVIVVLLVPAIIFNENAAFQTRDNNSRVSRHSVSNDESDKVHGILWVWQHFLSFARRPGLGFWLIVMCIYKIGDSLGSAMIKPLLVDIGLSLSAIAELTLIANICGILAAVIGGAIYYRVGPKWCLIGFGLIQGATLGAFALVNNQSGMPVITTLAVMEQVSDSLTIVVLFAVMMSHCRKGSEGADYTLQACLQVMVAGVGGLVSGIVVKFFGYETLFLSAMLVTWICLIPVYVLFIRDKYLARDEASFHHAP